MPGPCSGKNFGNRLYIFKREEARLSSSLLNIICCYQIQVNGATYNVSKEPMVNMLLRSLKKYSI